MEIITTNTDLCVGCNKCIAKCPVKANFAFQEDGKNKVKVLQDKCIHCGACIKACDHNVRDYIDDTERFFNDLKNGKKIALLVDPSIKFNFTAYQKLFTYLKRSGVQLIYDVGIGGDIAAWAYLKVMEEEQEPLIAQPCPVIVNYIQKYKPALIAKLAKINSPLLCTAIYFKKYGNVTADFAFISPCIGKFDEINDSQHNNLVKYNVTLTKLQEYLNNNNIYLETIPETTYDIDTNGLGDFFCKSGGLKEIILFCKPNLWIREIEGTKSACRYLKEYHARALEQKELPALVDVLNCKHGCLLGTGVQTDQSIDDLYLKVKELQHRKFNDAPAVKATYLNFLKELDRKLDINDFKRDYQDNSIHFKTVTGEEVNVVFEKLHKYSAESRKINCYSCGYGSCYEFAKAVAVGDNYLSNCIDYNRKELIDKNNDLFHSNKEAVQLQYLATHDFLTNIPNRYYLQSYIAEILGDVEKNNTSSALIFIDLDNFKVVNDSFGHSIGDEILIKVVDRLRRIIGENSILARLGGDEFAVLVKEANLEQSKLIATKLLNALRGENFIVSTKNAEIHITASFGITIIDGSLSAQEVLTYADTALYSAKENGKNRIMTIKNSDDKNLFSEANRMILKINQALQDDKFVLHAQPIFNSDKKITHFEILLRMLEPDDTLIYPNDFMAIAEKFGLVSEIDEWVVTKVVQLMEMRSDLSLFVNLSGYSLGDTELLNYIGNIVKNGKFKKEQLGFEITETAAIRDLDKAEHWINSIKKLGCKFALDDFGVGFSSFSYLQKIPVDYLKIDGSFIRNLDIDFTQRALVQSMNEVAHAMGKKTIAEYVENEKIWMILNEMQIDYGQGYYLGKPTKI